MPPRRAILAAAAAALAGSLLGCSKPIPPERAAYVGKWRGTGMDLYIEQKGLVHYRRVEGSVHRTIEMPLKEFQGDHFVVGIGPLATKFEVSSPPRKIGEQWKMTVDGVELTRREP